MIGPLFPSAIEAAQKAPWREIFTTTFARAAAVAVANAAAKKVADKLFKATLTPLL